MTTKNTRHLTFCCINYCLAVAMSGLMLGLEQGLSYEITTNMSFLYTYFPKIFFNSSIGYIPTDSDSAKGTSYLSPFPICNRHEFTIDLFRYSTYLAAAIGALITIPLLPRCGRPRCLLLAGLLYIIGSVVSAEAIPQTAGLAMLILGRVMIGFGIGISTVTSIVFIAELAPTNRRGCMCVLYFVFVVVGELFGKLISMSIVDVGLWGWRIAVATQTAAGVVTLLAGILVPDSPASQILHNELIEAKSTLQDLHGSTSVDLELQSIHYHVRSYRDTRFPSLSVFYATCRPQLVIAVVLGAVQQFTGLRGMQHLGYYFLNGSVINIGRGVGVAGGFDTRAGLGSARAGEGMMTNKEESYLLPGLDRVANLGDASLIGNLICIGSVELVAILTCFLIVDRVGRRPLLMISTFFLLLCNMVFGIGLHYYTHDDMELGLPARKGFLAVVCVFVFFHMISWGPLAFFIPAEIAPFESRASVVGLSVAVTMICTFASGLSYFPLSCHLSSYEFLVSAAVCALALIFVITTLPETGGNSLEEGYQVFAFHWFWRRTPVVHRVELPVCDPAATCNIVTRNDILASKTTTGSGSGHRSTPISFEAAPMEMMYEDDVVAHHARGRNEAGNSVHFDSDLDFNGSDSAFRNANPTADVNVNVNVNATDNVNVGGNDVNEFVDRSGVQWKR